MKVNTEFLKVLNVIGDFLVQNQNSADCPADTGTFRDKNRCNVYYTCVAYKIVARYECPEGYNFNDVKNNCSLILDVILNRLD